MRYKLGSIVTEASGNIGGMVAMGKGNGGVLRVKNYRRYKTDSSTRLNDAQFQQVVSAWRKLLSGERHLWSSSSYDGVSGFHLFVKINLGFLRAGAVMRLKPPLFSPLIRITMVNIVFSATLNVWTIELSRNTPSTQRVRICASYWCSVGCSVSPTPLARIRFVGVNTNKLLDVRAFYLAKFRVMPPVGSRVFLSMDTMSNQSGLVSLPQFAYTDVV